MVAAWLEAARFARESQVGPTNFDRITRQERLLANRLWKAEAFDAEERACVAQRVLCDETLDARLRREAQAVAEHFVFRKVGA
jgi:hypothetical protein